MFLYLLISNILIGSINIFFLGLTFVSKVLLFFFIIIHPKGKLNNTCEAGSRKGIPNIFWLPHFRRLQRSPQKIFVTLPCCASVYANVRHGGIPLGGIIIIYYTVNFFEHSVWAKCEAHCSKVIPILFNCFYESGVMD